MRKYKNNMNNSNKMNNNNRNNNNNSMNKSNKMNNNNMNHNNGMNSSSSNNKINNYKKCHLSDSLNSSTIKQHLIHYQLRQQLSFFNSNQFVSSHSPFSFVSSPAKTPDDLIKSTSKHAFQLVISSFSKTELKSSTLSGKRSRGQLDPNVINFIKHQTIASLSITEANWIDSWKDLQRRLLDYRRPKKAKNTQ